MAFPDGSGVDGADPWAGAYTAGLDGPAATAPGPGPAADPGANGSMFPAGLAPAPVEGPSGLPAWVLDPDAFVPSPEDRDPAAPAFNLGASPATSADVEAMLQAQLAAQALSEPPATVEPAGPAAPPRSSAERSMVLYGTGIPLSLSARASDDGLIYKVACKTGTLALSPGPGQVDLDVPLTLTDEMFADLVEAHEGKAFPYVTIPETHANGALENTGYVKALESLTKAELMADARIAVEGKKHVENDPEDTRYLLAGLGFTDAKAKEKAESGSVPDVSVGIKSDYRNKRTGQTWKHALEHVALTPIPWVDGLIPFAPAMVLSQMTGDALRAPMREDPDHPGIAFDGAFTEPASLELSTEVSMRGDDYNPAATRAALMALTPGDSLSWNWDVRVERLAAGGEAEGSYYLVRAPQTDDPSDYDYDSRPTLYTDLESAMAGVNQGVAYCKQRKANREARDRELMGRGGDAPAVAKYAQEPGADLNLAVFDFDPSKHPRDFKGKFKAAISGLKPGESVKLPDGTSVHRGKDNPGYFEISGVGGKDDKRSVTGVNKGEAYNVTTKHTKDSPHYESIKSGSNAANAKGVPNTGTLDDVAEAALKHSTSVGKKGELPDSLEGADAPAPGHVLADKVGSHYKVDKVDDKGVHVRQLRTAPGQTEHNPEDTPFDRVHVIPHDQVKDTFPGRPKTKKKEEPSAPPQPKPKPAAKGGTDIDAALSTIKEGEMVDLGKGYTLKRDGASYKVIGADGKVAMGAHGDTKDLAKSFKELTGVLDKNAKRGEPGSQARRNNLSATPEDDAILSLSGAPGSLETATHEENGMPSTPTSVEELLAQQQAELEALRAQHEQTTTALSAAQVALGSQGATLHANDVTKEIKGLVGALPPSVLLAAQAVMMEDKSWQAPAADGLNLSVQVVKPAAEGGQATVEERKLQSPTDIVRFMLSAIPAVGAGGNAAVQLAAIHQGLGELNLSAHDAANDDEARERRAKANVDEWEREHRPENFNADGTRKAAA